MSLIPIHSGNLTDSVTFRSYAHSHGHSTFILLRPCKCSFALGIYSYSLSSLLAVMIPEPCGERYDIV